MSTQRTSDEIMQTHNQLLAEMNRLVEEAKDEITGQYVPTLRKLMTEFVVARQEEHRAKVAEGTPPNEYSKPIDKSGCAK